MRNTGRIFVVVILLCGCRGIEKEESIGDDHGSCSSAASSRAERDLCILGGLDSEEKLARFFGAREVDFEVQDAFLTSKLLKQEKGVTLITQGSLDRLPRLEEQAEAWHGPLSAALYVRRQEAEGPDWEATLVSIRAMHERIESMQKCSLTISLLFANDPAAAKQEYDTLFPINSLRNLAVRNADTELIMVVDIDFIPSDGFHQFLSTRHDDILHRALSRHVWALVSLELHADFVPRPRTRSAVAELLVNRSVVVAEAYLNPAAHEPVDIQRWLVAEDFDHETRLPAQEGFEPFVLGAKSVLPDYDERFRGYGWDKTAHAQHLRADNFVYSLLPVHFAVARYHQPTPTAVRIFGDEPDTLLRTRMEWLYSQVSAEIQDGGYSPATSTTTSRERS